MSQRQIKQFMLRLANTFFLLAVLLLFLAMVFGVGFLLHWLVQVLPTAVSIILILLGLFTLLWQKTKP